MSNANDLRICGAREFETSDPMDLPDTAERLGPQHYPTPHRQSAIAMIRAIEGNGLVIQAQTHVVDGLRTMKGFSGNYGEITVPNAHLFSLFRVSHPTVGNDLLIGYRNSVAQSMARKACVGKYFPICTNVSLFGDDLVFSAKNTSGQTDIGRIAYEGVAEKVVPMFRTIEEQLDALRALSLGKLGRRAKTLALFEEKVLPAKLIQPMKELWANLTPESAPEVYEDQWNALGLMHSATRLTNDLGTRLQAQASQRISRFFGFGNRKAA